MPTEQGGYFAQLQAESDKSKKAETDLSIALSRRAELSNQLHSDQALAAAGATAPTTGASGAAANDTMSRIQQAQAHLDELLLKYTDRHPDVIAARATLEELSKRRDAELEKLRRGEATAIASSGAANNPVYQNIQLELNKVDVDIAALRVEVEQHQRSVAELRQRLNSAPQVEAEFQQLNRDYDVNKAQYTALLETYEKARLGERAETAGSVRFEILQPPTAPVGPIWPRRTPLLGVIWLGSLVAGIALAFGLNLLNPTVVSVRMINEITSFPVLGMTGVASPARHRMRTRLRALTLSMAVACWVAAFAGALFLNWSGVRLTIPAIRSLIRT
jgi:polysaccharide chain length determinant protein (PEP-CTERM system associated)